MDTIFQEAARVGVVLALLAYVWTTTQRRLDSKVEQLEKSLGGKAGADAMNAVECRLVSMIERVEKRQDLDVEKLSSEIASMRSDMMSLNENMTRRFDQIVQLIGALKK